MVDFMLEGFDSASALLRHYDREQSVWDLPRQGEFWDAVALAHGLGRRGAGRRIAVIDSGFDLTIPALLEQRVMGSIGVEPTEHGSVVALLVHEVAPESELLLYTTTGDGEVNAWLVADAIRDAAEHGADIINLSLGKPYPLLEVADREVLSSLMAGISQAPGDPGEATSTADALLGQLAARLAAGGWRQLIKALPDNPISQAVEFAAQRGATIVSASGNDADAVFVPAALPSVLSIGFQTVGRTTGEGMQKAMSLPPAGYSQSKFADFMVTQPQSVLGSSFATPLLAGFCALMQDPRQLEAYRTMGRIGAEASGIMRVGDFPDGWSPLAKQVDDLFRRAIEAGPHAHLIESHPEPCPECSFFAAAPYIDFGLWRSNWGDLDAAEQLLRTARAFAPQNVDAAANLAMTIARRVDHDRGSMSFEAMTRSLREAAGHMEFATTSRPQHEPYRRRHLEFVAAAENPAGWRLSAVA
jgi:hypothetical protein